MFTVSCHKSHPPAAVAVPITAMRVEPQTIPADFEFIGVGESSHIVQIRARVEGYLESIDYKEGSLVKTGDLLFVLDQRPFIAAVESAQGMLDRQNAILWNAEQTKNRMVPLYQQNAVSQRDLDRALADQLAAAAEVETAKADLYKAAINLGFTSIQAPVTGLSGQAKYREGALISPGAGDENLLTTLYVVDPIWVNFNISDNELLQLKQDVAEKQVQLPKDMHFQIEAILSDGTVVPTEGVIDFNNPAIQQSTGTMLFRSVFPNPKISIYPGQFVKVIVKGAVRPGAIAVPQTALVQGGKGTFVYVVENGKALERMVVPGDWYKDFWIINSGLKAGDIVVAIGVNKLQHESPVAIQSMLSSTLP
ncbi:MAG: efflux RND transporter periplasmic adaptor subunit [Chlamydiales bacterium]